MPTTPEQRLVNNTSAQSREADKAYLDENYDLVAAINKDDETRQEKELRFAREGLLHFTMASSSSNVVGVHYRVGKKIGEGSFGVIFEGTNLLNNQQVAIKFVCTTLDGIAREVLTRARNQEKAMRRNCAMNIEPTKS